MEARSNAVSTFAVHHESPPSHYHRYFHHPHHPPPPPSHRQYHQDHDIRISTSLLIIIVPIISLILLLFSIFLLVIICRHKSTNPSNRSTGIIPICSNNGTNPNKKLTTLGCSIASSTSSPSTNPGCIYGAKFGCEPPRKPRGGQVFTYRELEVATNQFSRANLIGNGEHGEVYRGILIDGSVVAVKTLSREARQGEREFRSEVDLSSHLQSPHLLSLHGYCADQQHRLLVFEFMAKGDLYRHLHPDGTGRIKFLDWRTRLKIALDCARGLEFLHERAVPPVIHTDLKCNSILLDQNYRAKISDFGLSRWRSLKTDLHGNPVVGTPGYVAPEYAATGRLTTKSNVYSYGVILLELLTGRLPIDTSRTPGEHVLVSWALPRLTNREKVVEMLDPSLGNHYSKKELVQVAAIAAVCVQSEPGYRPYMTDVVQSLIPLVKGVTINCTANKPRIQNSIRKS